MTTSVCVNSFKNQVNYLFECALKETAPDVSRLTNEILTCYENHLKEYECLGKDSPSLLELAKTKEFYIANIESRLKFLTLQQKSNQLKSTYQKV